MTIKKISAAVASLGFLLTLTELHGGPWAGTYIGAALLILGALAALNAGKIFQNGGNKTKSSVSIKRESKNGERRAA